MKSINNNKFSYYFIRFISDTIFAMVIWPLLDILIGKKEFVYSVSEYIICPIIFGLFSAFFTFILNRHNEKKDIQ